MRKTLYIIALAAAVCSCKKTPTQVEEAQPVIISLEQDEVTLFCGETKQVRINGTEAYCSALAENEFVAWASGGERTMEIYASHVGTTKVVIECSEAENKDTCVVKVVPSSDYVGGVPALFGALKSDVKPNIDPSYIEGYTDTQRGCITYTYRYSGYFVAARYYYDEQNRLIGIHKSINPEEDTETTAYINIATSLSQYMETLTSGVSERLFSHPDGYYAALYTPTLNNKLDVFYAKELNDAKNHTFIKFH